MKQRPDTKLNRSLFGRLFFSTSLIICAGFAILIVVTTVLSTKAWRSESQGVLKQSVLTVAELYIETENTGDSAELYRTAAAVANSYNSTVFFVNLDGYTFCCSDSINHTECIHIQNGVNKDIMETVINDGIYTESGKFGGMYVENADTVGVKLTNYNGETVGAVFMSARADSVTEYIAKILNTSLLAALIVLFALFIFIYFYVKSIVKPLQEMSDAAKAMVSGDFSRRVNVSHNDEVRELAESFNAMAESVESLESMRSSFITNVSHELKTPMTTIGGFVDAILSGTIPLEQQNHYLSIVSDEVRRMSSLVNSMLVLSKLDSGQTQLQRTNVDIFDIICRVVISFEREIERKHIAIIGMDSINRVMVECDGQLMHQVIYNLFDNAVKFTPDGGYISIFISEYNSRIEIYIKNSGEGIPEDDLKHVFERFYKTDKSRSMDKTGVGLGLYIVKSIMNYHNGDIQVKSVQGLYTQFTLILPKKHSAED